MHIFRIKVLIQFFVSSVCFEYHLFIIRKTICTSSFYGMFFMHLCKQSSRWKDGNNEHILPPARLIIWNGKAPYKIACWFTLRNCITMHTMHGTKNKILLYVELQYIKIQNKSKV